MRFYKRTLLSLGIAFAITPFVCSSVLAAVSVPHGIYLEGNYGISKTTAKSYPEVIGVTSIDNTGSAGSANLGYKIFPFLALEGGYTRYAPTRVMVAGSDTLKDSHYSIDVAVKGIVPLGGSGVELFAKVGGDKIYSKLTNESNESGTGVFAGGGIDYSWTPNLLTNIQYTFAQGNSNTGNAGLLSIGLAYLVDPTCYF